MEGANKLVLPMPSFAKYHVWHFFVVPTKYICLQQNVKLLYILDVPTILAKPVDSLKLLCKNQNGFDYCTVVQVLSGLTKLDQVEKYVVVR